MPDCNVYKRGEYDGESWIFECGSTEANGRKPKPLRADRELPYRRQKSQARTILAWLLTVPKIVL